MHIWPNFRFLILEWPFSTPRMTSNDLDNSIELRIKSPVGSYAYYAYSSWNLCNYDFETPSVGWIPRLEIEITFFSEQFFYFKKLDLTQWIMPILGIPNFWSNSLGVPFWDFCSIFEIALVALIYVGVSFSKSPILSTSSSWSIWYIKKGYSFELVLTHAI